MTPAEVAEAITVMSKRIAELEAENRLLRKQLEELREFASGTISSALDATMRALQ